MLLCFSCLIVKYSLLIYYALVDTNSINMDASITIVSLLKSFLADNDVCDALHRKI